MAFIVKQPQETQRKINLEKDTTFDSCSFVTDRFEIFQQSQVAGCTPPTPPQGNQPHCHLLLCANFMHRLQKSGCGCNYY